MDVTISGKRIYFLKVGKDRCALFFSRNCVKELELCVDKPNGGANEGDWVLPCTTKDGNLILVIQRGKKHKRMKETQKPVTVDYIHEIITGGYNLE